MHGTRAYLQERVQGSSSGAEMSFQLLQLCRFGCQMFEQIADLHLSGGVLRFDYLK